jgi:hypothetical protein
MVIVFLVFLVDIFPIMVDGCVGVMLPLPTGMLVDYV